MTGEYYVDNVFSYHRPLPDQVDKYAVIRSTAKDAAQTILKLCPDSRERNEALRAL